MLFQERYRHQPFWLLVGCVLANRTSWRSAEPVFRELRRRYPRIESLAAASPSHLHSALRPLGLWRIRAMSLVRLARAWIQRRPRTSEDVRRLPGCGKYAADSWAIFIEHRRDVTPTDKKLSAYLKEQHHGCDA